MASLHEDRENMVRSYWPEGKMSPFHFKSTPPHTHTIISFSSPTHECIHYQNAGKFEFWSTCAYLIDRFAMKPVVDQVVYEFRGWMNFKVIAGITSPCVPEECCSNSTDKNTFTVNPPCVYAPRGYQGAFISPPFARSFYQFSRLTICFLLSLQPIHSCIQWPLRI